MEQHRKDMEAGHGDIYTPLMPVAIGGTAVMGGITVVVGGPVIITEAVALAKSFLPSERALKAWKEVNTEQKKAINELFKGKEGAAEKVAKETLVKYEVAERQVKRGNDNNGEQQKRIELIEDLLKGK